MCCPGRTSGRHRRTGALRRVDGSSVYTVAGADRYTSQRILDAEQRLLTAAGRLDGASVDESAVDLALLEMAANGTALDVGQVSLVRQMCSSGARLQLAIAPAGAGKTTAMRALTLAWAEDGGQVIGLAPSAAAAGVLAEQTGIRTDTLAKLTWSLDHGNLPDWVAAVGPSTLVIIDEAGMADTLSLDTAVQFAVGRGASVRLIGDDQQLAAIGAGGVLRDITHKYGALRLTELHRFTDADEAAASLALREGEPEALRYYLDHRRVHVGDIATTTEDAFSAWVSDRAAGLDAIMIAPTRELVAQLNRRARAHRLDHCTATTEVPLADGNQGSVGDVIITRSNDRRLRLGANDWVKNGDRWTITGIGRGDLTVRHTRSRLTVRLPSDYVRTSTGLGYASTIHAAQGVSADTMHGLLAGQESRQQLYTMLTRGRHANHLYLQVVGDGDLHTLIRPDTIRPATATELLQQILARDESPRSASTLVREQQDPAVRLAESAERYVDALSVAAEEVVGSTAVQALGAYANQLMPGLSEEPAWATLHTHLLLVAGDDADPLQRLRATYDAKEINSADDRTALLDWRLDDTGQLKGRDGPLPWLPGIPDRIGADPTWGPYLHARSKLVAQLADQIRLNARGETPGWVAQTHTQVPAELIADIQVWRAATRVESSDLRPTGPAQLRHATRVWQQELDTRLAAVDIGANGRWRQVLAKEVLRVTADPFLPELAERLNNLTQAGFDATLLLRSAAAAGPLTDDHPAAALWWRILDQLPQQMPNQDPATSNAVPTIRHPTSTSNRQRPVPGTAPPPTFGPSR
jgi:hypothetical protein